MLFFIFIQILIENSVSKQCSAVSDLGLHCLYISNKKGCFAYMD